MTNTASWKRRQLTAEMATAAEDAAMNWLNDQPYSQRYRENLAKTRALPVYKKREELFEMYKKNDVMIVEGTTGSGKSTLIPLFLLQLENPRQLDVDRQHIACTQPRRLAVEKVAERVADLADDKLGNVVGYRHKERQSMSPSTRLAFVTDGTILQQLSKDPLMKEYACIVIDEAHERGVNSDILLALLKKTVAARAKTSRPLKLVVMSATLDRAKFEGYFPGAPTLSVLGRTNPIQIHYLKEPAKNRLDAAAECVARTILPDRRGDVLVFVSGEMDISRVTAYIKSKVAQMQGEGCTNIGPLNYHELTAKTSQADRLEIEATPPMTTTGWGRNITVATPVAQTSITLDRVDYVVDCGEAKADVFDPRHLQGYLRTMPISQADANQRAGRAGRVRPGKCFRMYTYKQYCELPEQVIPEICRVSMTPTVMILARLKYDPICFDYLDAPATETIAAASKELFQLGFTQCQSGRLCLTGDGEDASQYSSLEPHHAKAMLVARETGCANEVAAIIGMLQATDNRSLYWNVKGGPLLDKLRNVRDFYRHPAGDHMTLLMVFYDFAFASNKAKFCHDNMMNLRVLESADRAVKQILGKQDKAGLRFQDPEWSAKIRKALCFGMFQRCAVSTDDGRSYKTITGLDVNLAEDSKLNSCPIEHRKSVIFESVTAGVNGSFITNATAVKMEWLQASKPVGFWPPTLSSGSIKTNAVETAAALTSLPEESFRGPVLDPSLE